MAFGLVKDFAADEDRGVSALKNTQDRHEKGKGFKYCPIAITLLALLLYAAIPKWEQGWGCSYMTEHLPSMCQALGSTPALQNF